MNFCVKYLQSCSFYEISLYNNKITLILADEKPYRKIYMYEIDDQLNKIRFSIM